MRDPSMQKDLKVMVIIRLHSKFKANLGNTWDTVSKNKTEFQEKT